MSFLKHAFKRYEDWPDFELPADHDPGITDKPVFVLLRYLLLWIMWGLMVGAAMYMFLRPDYIAAAGVVSPSGAPAIDAERNELAAALGSDTSERPAGEPVLQEYTVSYEVSDGKTVVMVRCETAPDLPRQVLQNAADRLEAESSALRLTDIFTIERPSLPHLLGEGALYGIFAAVVMWLVLRCLPRSIRDRKTW